MSFRIRCLHRGTPTPAPSSVTYDTAIGLGVDTSGRANLTPRVGASIFYVNSTTGSDVGQTSTTAQSPLTPCATVKKAMSFVTTGNGDHVLIAQGMSYPNGLCYIGDKGGFSAQYPMVIQSYDPADPTNQAKWGTATGTNRPIIAPNGTDMGGGFIQGGGVSQKYRAFRGLQIDPGSNLNDMVLNILPNTTGSPDYMLWENCVLAYTGIAGDFSAATTMMTKFVMRNCSSYGQWSNSLGAGNQGLFLAAVDGVTVEDNVLWHNGWKVGANRSDAATSGGGSSLNHPLYIQGDCINCVERRNFINDGCADGGNLKGGGLQMFNFGLNNPIAMSNSGSNLYDIFKPLGATAETAYNAIIGGGAQLGTSGGPTDWGITFVGTASGSRMHHNVMARSSAQAQAPFMLNAITPLHTNATAAMAEDSYLDVDHNVFYQWSASGSSLSGVGYPGQTDASNIPGKLHYTATNNYWDDPTSGSNVNISSLSTPNAYTESSIMIQLGYANTTAAINDWIINPQAHGWRNAWSLILTGYGVSLPSLGDLSTSMALTIGVPSNGYFLGTIDGTSLTSSTLPSGVTMDSDCRCWRYDGTGTAGSGTAAVRESDGTNFHDSSIGWTRVAQPVLSSIGATHGTTTATISLSTDTGSGTLYWIVSASGTTPTWPYLKIGLNADFSLPAAHGSQSVSATGSQSISVTGLTTATAYHGYLFQLVGTSPSLVGSCAFTTS